MGIERIRIDYTVNSPNYKPGEGLCLGFDRGDGIEFRTVDDLPAIEL